MSREVIIRKRDDLDPQLEADETLEFTFEGVTYTTDLSAEHAENLRDFLTPYMASAFDKKRLSSPKAGSREGLALPEELREKIRRWGKKNGMAKEAETKLLGFEIRSAYYDATGDERVLSGNLIAWREKRERDQIRRWANHNGHSVSAMSVIPNEVVEAYRQACSTGEAIPRGVDGLDPTARRTIRQWAQENGHPVGVRGLISREIQDAYRAAGGEL